jgi:hypothetical protein
MAGLPDLLTIEEAAKVIRVGRTKAYAMAREWRDTEGHSGLPGVDFGHALRVPRCQLEKLVGGPLADVSTPCDQPAPATVSDPGPAKRSRVAPRRPARRRTRAADQPSLPFES